MVHMVLRPVTRAAAWTTMEVGTICSGVFSGVVLVQGVMLLQLYYWNPYVWVRTPAIPFGIWTGSTLLHFGQMATRDVFITSGRITATAIGLGVKWAVPRLSKKRMLFEILWLGVGTCVSYLLTGGWAERQELHRATRNLELMLLRIQDLKVRIRRQLQAGMEPSVGVEQLEACRHEVRVYIRSTRGYFPEVVEAAEAIYLELTETMGLIKMAREADTRCRESGGGEVG
ncbi:hypothetical protein BGZ95_000260, partial [Linnemannia exigua]